MSRQGFVLSRTDPLSLYRWERHSSHHLSPPRLVVVIQPNPLCYRPVTVRALRAALHNGRVFKAPAARLTLPHDVHIACLHHHHRGIHHSPPSAWRRSHTANTPSA